MQLDLGGLAIGVMKKVAGGPAAAAAAAAQGLRALPHVAPAARLRSAASSVLYMMLLGVCLVVYGSAAGRLLRPGASRCALVDRWTWAKGYAWRMALALFLQNCHPYSMLD